jgi:hypothetical protein
LFAGIASALKYLYGLSPAHAPQELHTVRIDPPFLEPFLSKNDVFCQDRLGTNISETPVD